MTDCSVQEQQNGSCGAAAERQRAKPKVVAPVPPCAPAARTDVTACLAAQATVGEPECTRPSTPSSPRPLDSFRQEGHRLRLPRPRRRPMHGAAPSWPGPPHAPRRVLTLRSNRGNHLSARLWPRSGFYLWEDAAPGLPGRQLASCAAERRAVHTPRNHLRLNHWWEQQSCFSLSASGRKSIPPSRQRIEYGLRE